METNNPVISVKFNREYAKEMWFDRNCFFCTYKLYDNNKLVLTDASPMYFSVINRNRNCCGQEIDNILNKCNSAYIKEVFLNYSTGKPFNYVRKCSLDNTLWLVTALNENGMMNCMGRRLSFTELAQLEHVRSEESSFSITIISAYHHQDESFRIVSCGISEPDSFPSADIRAGMCLDKLMDIYSFNVTGQKLLVQCMKADKAVCYYDFVTYGKNHAEVIKISLTPVSDKNQPMLVIRLEKADGRKTEICRDNTEHDISCGMCKLSADTEGNVLIRQLDKGMTELLSAREIRSEQICRREYFSMSESKTIIGRSGMKYEICVISESCDENNQCCSVLIIPIYCNNSSERLTHREGQILKLAAQGNPNRYIAKILNISEGTVKKILHNGYSKLGIGSRVELVKYFTDNNISL